MTGGENMFDLMAGVERVASELKTVTTQTELDKLTKDVGQLQKQAQGLKENSMDASQASALEKLAKELDDHMASCTSKKAALISGEGINQMRLQVACRIRPSKNGSDPGVIPVSRNQVSVKSAGSRGDRRKTFNYAEVFGPESTQDDLFSFVHRWVMLTLDGEKVCVCAYGQTGSGKSHTMTGSPSEKLPQKGIYQHTLESLFHAMENDEKAEVCIQIFQVCNEITIDLCSDEQAQVASADKASKWPIKSSAEGLEKFEQSLENKTAYIARSGVKRMRSHQIISIFIQGRNGQKEAGCLQFVDLSGSERVGRTEATVERLEEAKHVNKSLGALGDALSALTSKKSTVALNANKLTEALTPTLGGLNCKCILIVHIAPEDCFRGESLSSLMYGQMVSALKDGHEGKEKLFGARKAFSQMVANDPSNREREVQMRLAARSAMSEKEDMERDLRGLRDELNLTRRSLRDMESKSLFRHSRSTSVVSPGGAGSDASSRDGSRSDVGLRTSRSSSAVSRTGVSDRMSRLDRQRRGVDRPYIEKGRRLSIAFEEPDTPGSIGKQMKNVNSSEVLVA